MEYQEIIHTIENKRRFGSLPGVVVSRKLLAAVGDPQNDLAFIHIAGTNGKGSTAAFLREILKEAGIRAGMFTSPHLIDFTERIQVDGRQIPREDAARLGEMLLNLDLDVHPTMFDYCLAMALLYFREQGCRLVILETGLGGRLDSTNVISAPLVSVITKIGYDHTEGLGDTLDKIAAEKAGILKPNTFMVSESQQQPAEKVLKDCCSKLGISYQFVEAEKIKAVDHGFSYEGKGSYRMRMLGMHQRENAMAAVFAAEALRIYGFEITDAQISQGIENATWNGRMELISQEPYLLIDGAHNGHGVHALAESLKELYPDEKFHFIMGVLADKDYKQMVKEILPLAESVTTVTPDSGRALQGETLAEYIRSYGVFAENTEQMQEAFLQIRDKTVAFGSLYFIGEIRKFFHLA